jgi:4-carboxymuconolactone decarboxylase
MSGHERLEEAREGYQSFFGSVPESYEERARVARLADRLTTLEALEELRRRAIYENPLGARVQQLVHFGQLLVLGEEEAAMLHARTAVRHGAGLADLVGVVETALVTAGVPAYARGMRILASLEHAEHGNDD